MKLGTNSFDLLTRAVALTADGLIRELRTAFDEIDAERARMIVAARVMVEVDTIEPAEKGEDSETLGRLIAGHLLGKAIMDLRATPFGIELQLGPTTVPAEVLEAMTDFTALAAAHAEWWCECSGPDVSYELPGGAVVRLVGEAAHWEALAAKYLQAAEER